MVKSDVPHKFFFASESTERAEKISPFWLRHISWSDSGFSVCTPILIRFTPAQIHHFTASLVTPSGVVSRVISIDGVGLNFSFINVIIEEICPGLNTEGVPHQKYRDSSFCPKIESLGVITPCCWSFESIVNISFSRKETYFWTWYFWIFPIEANRQYLHFCSQNGIWI